MRRIALLMTLVLAIAACGGGDDAAVDGDGAALPPADGQTDPLASGACLVGEPDCQDTGDPNAEPLPLPDSIDEPIAGPIGMSVDEVLSLDSIDGPFAVEGFLVVDADGSAQLCTALAESFPPQCGGDRLSLGGDVPGLGEFQSEQGVTWSDFPVLFEGTWDGAIFTIAG